MLCGLETWVYWLTSFIWDTFTFIIPSTGFVLILLIIGDNVRVPKRRRRRVQGLAGSLVAAFSTWATFLAFGVAGISVSYVFSFWIGSPSKGYGLVFLLNVLTGKSTKREESLPPSAVAAFMIFALTQTLMKDKAEDAAWLQYPLSVFSPVFNLIVITFKVSSSSRRDSSDLDVLACREGVPRCHLRGGARGPLLWIE